MASEKDLELLDEYLTNRLKGNAKAEFEEKLRKDKDLQSELAFQEQIAGGLRNARAAELKTMLKNIPISAAMTQGNNYLGWTGAAIVLALGAGIFLFLHKTTEEPSGIPSSVKNEKVTPPVVSKAEAVTDSVSTATTPHEVNVKPEAGNEARKKAPTNESAPSPVKVPKKLEVFDPSSEADSDVNAKAPQVDVPVEVTSAAAGRTVNVDNNNKKYKFHYQLNGDTLTLFGDFEKNLYTIMEFNSDNRERVVFMFYKNSYYLLNQSPGQINRLVPVNDPVLLNRLREQRTSD